ncbi:MAG TPA: AIM24 family protein, partial [Streptosporangiaceae bacterium]
MTGYAPPTYTCPYCRMVNNDDGSTTCPRCGAPVDIRLRVSNSGWCKQPPIRDMARLRFSRSTCQISGAYVPVAEMQLHDDDWVYFSHHVLLHTEPRVRLDSMRMQGGWNRIMAGMPLIMMRAQGPGFVAFSADHPGEVLAIPLEPNQGVDVVEHQFLVATGNIGYQWHNSNVWYTTRNGDDTEWLYPVGKFIDRFIA